MFMSEAVFGIHVQALIFNSFGQTPGSTARSAGGCLLQFLHWKAKAAEFMRLSALTARHFRDQAFAKLWSSLTSTCRSLASLFAFLPFKSCYILRIIIYEIGQTYSLNVFKTKKVLAIWSGASTVA